MAHASRQREVEEQRSLSTACRRVRSAVQAVARAERAGTMARGASGRLRTSWGRGPKRAIRQETSARHGKWRNWPGASGGAVKVRSDGTYASTFHFALRESRSGEAARKHQLYIEREGACIASFGTLGETLMDRSRVWPALERTRTAKRGKVRIEGVESEEELEAIRVQLARWASEGKVNAGRARRWEERVRAKLRGEDVDKKELRIDIWTTNREEHEQVVAQAEGAWPTLEKRELARRIRATKPKEPIVQRRIIFELAHEVDDEAREEIVRNWCRRNLADVSWHAAIHMPENDNDDRNYHAHIVYTQFPIERAKEPDGSESNHWQFELDGQWPKLSETARVLWGNGPDGRRGATKLITGWREDLANIQNEALRGAGAAKRYDHRSYEAMGVARTPGVHRGPALSALHARDAQAAPQPSADDAWNAIEARIVEMGEARGQWGESEREQLREIVQTLRLASGLERDEDPEREESRALREMVERWFPERPAANEIVEWARQMARRNSAGPIEEPWLKRWRDAIAQDVNEADRRMLAVRIEAQWGDDARRYHNDIRPDVRSIRSEARRWRMQIAPWRTTFERMREAENRGDDQSERMEKALAQMEIEGVRLRWVAGPAIRRWLVDRRRALRVSKAIEALEQTMMQAREIETTERQHAIWQRRHRRTCDRLGESGKALWESAQALCDAAVIRIAWRHSSTDVPPSEAQEAAQAIMRGPAGAAEHARQQRALAVLDEGTHAEIRNTAERGEAAAQMHRHREQVLRVGRETLDASEGGRGDPEPLERLDRSEEVQEWIRRYDRYLAGAIDRASSRVKARGAALDLQAAKVKLTARDPQGRAEQAAALSPTSAAALIGTDMRLIEHRWPEVVSACEPALEAFARVVGRRMGRVATKSPEGSPEHERELSRCANAAELAVLSRVAPTRARAIMQAKLRVEEREGEIRRDIEARLERLQSESDPDTQAFIRHGLGEVLQGEDARRVLSRPQWVRAVRSAGLAETLIGRRERTERRRKAEIERLRASGMGQ